MGDFEERMDELAALVGSEELIGTVVVDQVYAHYQHESLDLKHPHGGRAKYLSSPLFNNRDRYLLEIARTILDDGGKDGMIAAVEQLSEMDAAPREFGNLGESGRPFVHEGGELIYDRPPRQARLSEAQLRAEARALPMDAKLEGWIWRHILGHHGTPPHGGHGTVGEFIDRHVGGG